MKRQRRKAQDFTESLNSFRYTETDCSTAQSYSEDSLNEITGSSIRDDTFPKKNNSTLSNARQRNDHSTILAGSSTKDSLMQNASRSRAKLQSVLQSVPDLNKCINLFQNESISKQIKHNAGPTNKENCNPQSLKKGMFARNDRIPKTVSVIPKQKAVCSHKTTSVNTMPNKESKRDTNHNLQTAGPTNVKVTNFEGQQGNKDGAEFETLLCTLDNQLNQIKEGSNSQQILRRLSDKYINSPKNFTEKLLTIIEESVTKYDDETGTAAGPDLSRLTTEFKKMCKFIEDESVIDWPPSPVSLSSRMEQISSNLMCHKNSNNKNENTPVGRKSLTDSPVDRFRYLRKNHKMVKNESTHNTTHFLMNECSSLSFENLEAQCKRLFSDDEENAKPVRKSLSFPSLLSMSNIHVICEKQMASLDTSDKTDEEHEETVVMCTPKRLNELKCSGHSPVDAYRKISLNSESNQNGTDKTCNNYLMVDPDELEKTLLQDIAEKRKRCLDTAKVLTEINADPTVAENTIQNDNESKFLNTLMSCKYYHNYMNKRTEFYKFVTNLNLSGSATPPAQSKLKETKTKNTEKNVSSAKKSSSTKNVCLNPNSRLYPSSSKKKENIFTKTPETRKQKLFHTPGKSPQIVQRTKKANYFTDGSTTSKNTVRGNIVKSPHAKGLYRLNYNTVISPVSMYIKGTDMRLVKNVCTKTNNLLLTPGNVKAKGSTVTPIKQITPLEGVRKIQKKVSPRIHLTPKLSATPRLGASSTGKGTQVSTPTIGTDNTPKREFQLLKVNYKLPLHARTIKENKSSKTGNRVNRLLENAQSKVVIRHEGRVKSVEKKKAAGVAREEDVFEIHYKPEDESIHVEQTASKSNFISKGSYM